MTSETKFIVIWWAIMLIVVVGIFIALSPKEPTAPPLVEGQAYEIITMSGDAYVAYAWTPNKKTGLKDPFFSGIYDVTAIWQLTDVAKWWPVEQVDGKWRYIHDFSDGTSMYGTGEVKWQR